jgi:phosphoribosylamine--glycine ligase
LTVGIELFCSYRRKSYKILPTAKDYKRIGEGDTGLNTGGMGVSPVPYVDAVLMEK